MSLARAAAARAAAALVVVALAACGSSHRPNASAIHPGFQGLIIRPPKTAPQIELPDYTGRRVNLDALRGHAVLLTFVYTHCPDVCPLMVSALAEAQRELGGLAARVRMLAVSVDPKGDSARSVRAFLAARGATGRVDYLIGTHRQLAPVWRAYGIAVTINPAHVVQNAHSALVFGITPAGKVVVVYPSNFTPGQIVHDVPLLLRS